MNAGQASELVAEFIDSNLPQDKERVRKILRLAMNRAWQEGKWFKMTAEFFVSIQQDCNGDKFIVSPRGYSTLLALNVNGKTTIPRDNYFMFHRNGYGDIKSHGNCNWNEEDHYDSGVFPTLPDFKKLFPNGAVIGTRSLSQHGENESINVQGNNEDAEIAISYEVEKIKESCCFNPVEVNKVRSIQGVNIPVTKNPVVIQNFVFKSIDAITKTHTRGIVEVYGFDPKTGKGHKIAMMYPWETSSRYKRYMIPNTCCDCVHGLFKIDIQPDIIDDSQPIIIENEEALIALAKGIHKMYYKDNIEAGKAFLLEGFNALEKQKREEETEDVFPIQVVGGAHEDVPKILKEM